MTARFESLPAIVPGVTAPRDTDLVDITVRSVRFAEAGWRRGTLVGYKAFVGDSPSLCPTAVSSQKRRRTGLHMTTSDDRLDGGPLNAAIANEIGKLVADFTGRGAPR